MQPRQTSAECTVRVLYLSPFRPDFQENHVRCLSTVRIMSVFSIRRLSARILSVSILSAFWILFGFSQKMLFSVCPAGQVRDRAVRNIGGLVGRFWLGVRKFPYVLVVELF